MGLKDEIRKIVAQKYHLDEEEFKKYCRHHSVLSKKQIALNVGGTALLIGGIVALAVLITKGTSIKTNHYSVTFVANTDDNHNGRIQSEPEKTFTDLSKLDAGYSPDTLPNYTFDYWCKDSSTGEKVEFPVTFSKNEKYYAHWSKAAIQTWNVKFDTDGGSPVGDHSVVKGESISRPESTKEHYSLKAWRKDSRTGEEVFKKDPVGGGYEQYAPDGNTTIYAEWEQKEFNVGLVLDGGTAPSDAKDIKIGGVDYKGYPYTSKLDTAPIPTKTCNTFMGWFETEEKTGSAVQFPYTPTKDTLLYAKWEESTEIRKININANGGYLPKVGEETTDPQTREVTISYIPYAPTAYYNPTYKDQYELLGWFDADTGGNEITFPHTVVDGETIYAHWKQVKFSATIYANSTEDGTTVRKLNSWDNLSLVRYADIPTPQAGDMKLESTGSAADPSAYTLKEWEVYNLSEGKPEEAEPAGALDITPLTYNAKINAKWVHTKFTVTLHNGTGEGAATSELKYQTTETLGTAGPSVPSDWVTEHSVFTGWNDKDGNKIDFSTFELTEDTDFYKTEEVAMGKVYLHTSYATTSSTYNGDSDYYYTETYKSYGAGFAARDLPDKDHYKKLGWTYTDTALDKETWTDPSESPTIYSKECETHIEGTKIYPWPSDGVRPLAGRIAHLYPTYEQSEFEIKFSVGEKATACNSIWTGEKDSSGNARIASTTTIPTSSKTFSTFKGWKLNGELFTSANDWETLRKHDFTEDTTLTAVFDTSAWTVNFNIIAGVGTHENYTVGLSQEGLTQLSSGSLSDIVSSLESSSSTKRTGAKLAGFVTEANKPTTNDETYVLTNIISSLTLSDDANLYAVYYKADYTVTIYPNGGTIGGSTEARTLVGSNEPVSDKSIWYSELSEYGTIVAPSDLPTFYGFAIHDTATIIDFPYTLSGDVELDMIWVNNSKYMVTFDAGNGDFYYTQGGITRTTPIISYEVDTTDTSIWSSSYTTTLKNVYEQARKARGCLDTDYLVNDGYTFKGWKYEGVLVDDSYLVKSSKGFEASWERADVSNWWDDSTGLIISYAEDMSDPSSTTYNSVLEEKYYAAFHGTQATKGGATGVKAADTFVGLEKEIKIPTLSTTYYLTTRVIGEKQDYASDGTTKTYLTIQFVDAPVSGCYASDSAKDARYGTSVIKNSFIPYLLGSIPGSLSNHFQSVKKPYLTSESSTKSADCTTMTCTDESLFILSAYELGGSTSGSANYENTYKGDYSKYMVQYTYYSGLGDGSTSSAITKRAFTYPYTSSTTYINAWTRTPKGSYKPKTETEQDVYFIGCNTSNINLGAFCSWDPMSGYGICPAFCIGLYTR